jgi:hypothetical protein
MFLYLGIFSNFLIPFLTGSNYKKILFHVNNIYIKTNTCARMICHHQIYTVFIISEIFWGNIFERAILQSPSLFTHIYRDVWNAHKVLVRRFLNVIIISFAKCLRLIFFRRCGVLDRGLANGEYELLRTFLVEKLIIYRRESLAPLPTLVVCVQKLIHYRSHAWLPLDDGPWRFQRYYFIVPSSVHSLRIAHDIFTYTIWNIIWLRVLHTLQTWRPHTTKNAS